MDRSLLAGVGVVLALIACADYLHDVVKNSHKPNHTQPHPISWIVWTLIGGLGISISIRSGAGPGVYVAVIYFFLEVIITLLSFNKKYGKWYGVQPSDIVLGIIAASGAVLWGLGVLPKNMAALVVVLADAAVAWFTIREGWRRPWTESVRAWSTSAMAATIGAFALENTSFAAAAYPIYLAVGETTIAAVLIFRTLQLGSIRNRQKV